MHVVCIRYQIILHDSHVASPRRKINFVFVCNAGGGGSLHTSKP